MKGMGVTCQGVLMCLLLIASLYISYAGADNAPSADGSVTNTDTSPTTAPNPDLSTTTPSTTTTTTATPTTLTTIAITPSLTTASTASNTVTTTTTASTAAVQSSVAASTTTTASTPPLSTITTTEPPSTSPTTTTAAAATTTIATSSTTSTISSSAGATTISVTSVPSGEATTAADSTASSSFPDSSTGSTQGSTTTAESTSTTTSTTTSATTSSNPAYPIKKPEKPFKVNFQVGDSDASAVYCVGSVDCTFSARLQHIQSAFSGMPGYLYVREKDGTSQRRKRATQFSVEVLFDNSVVQGITEKRRTSEMVEALWKLNMTDSMTVNMTKANESIVAAFASADICSLSGACPGGYKCKEGWCHHLCESYECGEHGDCNAVVGADGSNHLTCVCMSTDEHTYSGDRCQEEALSKAKMAAIVGGVLGTICALFLIVILFLAYRLRSDDSGEGSRGKYQFGGASNNGYTDPEFSMKNVSSENL